MRTDLARLLALALVLLLPAAAHAQSEKESRYAEIPVPATMIYAGQAVQPSMMLLRKVPKSYLARTRVVADISLLEGKLARSTLVPGRPIPINQLREPDVIKASRPVRVLFRLNSLEIVGEAMPLSSAAAGERVRARNIDTGLIVTGTARNDGVLVVSESQ